MSVHLEYPLDLKLKLCGFDSEKEDEQSAEVVREDPGDFAAEGGKK